MPVLAWAGHWIIGHWNVPAPGALFVTGGRLPVNALFAASTEGAVGNKPSESGNNMPFQRHRCPGPDFKAKKGKNAVSSRNFSLECHLFHYPIQITIFIITRYPLVVGRFHENCGLS